MNSAFTNWSDVRVFLAVLRGGSTLAASKQLGMAQPTVARRIDALEHATGLSLFHRDTRGFHPTSEACALAPMAEAMETAATRFGEKAADIHTALAGLIRFTAPPQSFSPNLAAILSDFSEQNPGVTFELLAESKVLNLAAGEADVGLRFAAEMHDGTLICTKLTDVRASLYAAPGYVARHGKPTSEHELHGHKFVVSDQLRRSFTINTWLVDRIAADQIVTRGSSFDAIIAAVLAGLGVAPLPNSLAADHPNLIKCFEPPVGTGVSSWLVISPDAHKRPEVRAFSKFFAARFRAVFRKMANGT